MVMKNSEIDYDRHYVYISVTIVKAIELHYLNELYSVLITSQQRIRWEKQRWRNYIDRQTDR